MKALLLATSLFAAGCAATTHVTGYTDPAFVGRTYTHAAVLAVTGRMQANADIEERACASLVERGVKCTQMTPLFPPTRQYTTEELHSVLRERGVEAVLIFALEDDQSRRDLALVQSTATVNPYGGQASAVPIHVTRRQSRARVELMDRESRKTAWIANSETRGQGRFGASDSEFSGSLARGTIAALVEAGHFRVTDGR